MRAREHAGRLPGRLLSRASGNVPLRGHRGWAGPLLGHWVAVRGGDRAAADELVSLLGGHVGEPPQETPVVEIAITATGNGQLAFWVDGASGGPPVAAGMLPARALDALNRRLCFGPGPLLVVHCAVVAHDEGALLLYGGSGAGKSTLAAGLVRAGWTYLSDEGAGLDGAGRVHPYTRPITLKPSSWPLFPELDGRLPARHERFAIDEWHVPAALLGTLADAPADPGATVAVRFEMGAPTELAPIRRSAALEAMAHEACNLRLFGRAGFEKLRDLVLACRCYRLVYGDLQEALTALASVELRG